MKILLLMILAGIFINYGVDAWSRSRGGGGGSWGSRRRSVSSGWGSRRRTISFDSRRRTTSWNGGRRRTPVISSRRRTPVWGRRRTPVVSSRRRTPVWGRRRTPVISSRRRTPVWGRRRTPVVSSRRRWGSGSSSSSGGGSRSFPHDVKTKSGLTRLYNQRVVKAERVERPLGGPLGSVGIKHSGVRVTLADGKTYLVHKGRGYGKSSQTVVTDAKHMSNKWKVTQTNQNVRNAKVSDYVKAGGKNYNFLFDNCHSASRRGMCIKGK